MLHAGTAFSMHAMIQPPRHFNFFTDVVERLAKDRGREIALVELNERGAARASTFAETARAGIAAAGALATAGARRGDAILTMCDASAEWVAAILGAWRLGAVALPCSEMLTARDLTHRLRAASPSVAFVAERHLRTLRAASEMAGVESAVVVADTGALEREEHAPAPAARTVSEDPALIVFTSGTTGEPRAVLHAQRYLWGQRVQATHSLGAKPGDVVWCTAKPGWSKSSRNNFVAPWLRGAAAVVAAGRFDPATRADQWRESGATVVCQSPTEFRLMAKAGVLDNVARGRLRHFVSAGEALNPQIVQDFEDALGLSIHDQYGQTELGAITCARVGEPVVRGSMGRPLPGFRVEIRDGELWVDVRSVPTALSRYVDGGDAPAGWHATGDLVRRSEDGALWYVGRADDIIGSSGYRIGPLEVESALCEHAKVAEAAAVGVPDPDRRAIVKAFIVLRDGETGTADLAAELQSHVKTVTAPYKYPRLIEFVDALPKTASGKVMRAELRARQEARADSTPWRKQPTDKPPVGGPGGEAR